MQINISEDEKLELADLIILAVSRRLDVDFTEMLWAELNDDIVAVIEDVK